MVHQQEMYMHCCLARDEAESTRSTKVLLSKQLLAIVGTEQCSRPECMHKMCFLPLKPEKLLSAISML